MHKRHIGRLRLRTITVLSVSLATLVAVAICITVFSTVYSSTVRQDARVNASQSVEQTEAAVSSQLDDMKDKLTAVSAVIPEDTTEEDFHRRISALAAIEREIFAVTVYDENGGILASVGSGYKRKEHPLRDLSFDRELYEGTEGFILSAPHVQTLYEGVYPWVVTLAVRTASPVLGTGVYVAIDFSFSELAAYIDRVGVGRHGYCYIVDSGGNLIYHPQQQLIFSDLRREETAQLSAWADGVHTDGTVIHALKTASDSRWRIVGVSYTDDLVSDGRDRIIWSIGVSLVFCAAILFAVLEIDSRIVSRPVRELADAMKRFEESAEDFRYFGGQETVSELHTLSLSFAHLTGRVQELMEQVRREETALRKTELKALQAQINPHFLYNTLDSIQWMCERGKDAEAAKMVGALAKLFRISISRGHELIPLADELQHAKSYLVIQSYRYRDQFSYRFDVDDSLLHYLCNKITVQPLIENAIYHGIDRMVDEGEIVISVHEAADCPDDILITVSDNGIGMTEEQCRKILQKEKSDSGGIGVKNVNDRLKIWFGDRYGLTIRSVPDEGTTVTVRIPKVEKEEERL